MRKFLSILCFSILLSGCSKSEPTTVNDLASKLKYETPDKWQGFAFYGDDLPTVSFRAYEDSLTDDTGVESTMLLYFMSKDAQNNDKYSVDALKFEAYDEFGKSIKITEMSKDVGSDDRITYFYLTTEKDPSYIGVVSPDENYLLSIDAD